MKKMGFLILVVSIMLTATPVFAAEATLFQIVGDSISAVGKGSAGKKPATVGIFNKLKDHIADWDESSVRAKKLTLRGRKEELAKRRGLSK